MIVIFSNPEMREEFLDRFLNALKESRFAVSGIDLGWKNQGRGKEKQTVFTLSIHRIRLKESKPYCGNHPGPCLLSATGVVHKNKKSVFLEGADWVAFNDMLNDILDEMDVEAYVASKTVVIRKGRLRRINYGMYEFAEGHFDWDKEGTDNDYVDRCGMKSGPSTYPDSTPGIGIWRMTA